MRSGASARLAFPAESLPSRSGTRAPDDTPFRRTHPPQRRAVHRRSQMTRSLRSPQSRESGVAPPTAVRSRTFAADTIRRSSRPEFHAESRPARKSRSQRSALRTKFIQCVRNRRSDRRFVICDQQFRLRHRPVLLSEGVGAPPVKPEERMPNSQSPRCAILITSAIFPRPIDYYREVTDSAVFKTFSPHRSGSAFTLKWPTLFNQKHEPRL